MTHRRRHSFFYSPSAPARCLLTKAIAQCVLRYSGYSGKIGQRVLSSEVYKSQVGYTIVRLLSLRGPPTISGRVVSGVVDAIERRTWRTHSHVREEIFKYSPLIAQFYSAALIVCVGWIGRVKTPREHRLPRLIGRRWLAIGRMAVCLHVVHTAHCST